MIKLWTIFVLSFIANFCWGQCDLNKSRKELKSQAISNQYDLIGQSDSTSTYQMNVGEVAIHYFKKETCYKSLITFRNRDYNYVINFAKSKGFEFVASDKPHYFSKNCGTARIIQTGNLISLLITKP